MREKWVEMKETERGIVEIEKQLREMRKGRARLTESAAARLLFGDGSAAVLAQPAGSCAPMALKRREFSRSDLIEGEKEAHMAKISGCRNLLETIGG